MRKRTLLASFAAAAVLAAGAAVYAQPYGSGWMMGGSGGGYGPGMMGGYGPGMMGQGMMGGGYGPGWMHGGYGPGYAGGYISRDLKLTVDDVKNSLERTIRNPRLKVGDVKEADGDTITADIVTKEKDALVQRITVNRHTGYWRPDQQ